VCGNRKHVRFNYGEDIFEAFWSDGSVSLEPRSHTVEFFDVGVGPSILRAAKEAGYVSKPRDLCGALTRAGSGSGRGKLVGSPGFTLSAVAGDRPRERLSDTSEQLPATAPVSDVPNVLFCKSHSARGQFHSLTKLCVPFAFFKLCVHAGRPLTRLVQEEIRHHLKTVLCSVWNLVSRKGPWRIVHIPAKKRSGQTAVEWVVSQTSGYFLVADPHHCVAVDAGQRLVLDGSAKDKMTLTLDLLTRQRHLHPTRSKVWRVS
jgi:hypothetical protein